MALPQQLKAARASDSTTASTIDNVIGELETALANIFGFTLDTDVTASPFSLNNSGQITKSLVAQRAAGPVGWRMRDTTSGKEVRLVVNGLNFDIDENTGSEAVPAWTNRFRMVISSGALTGTAATASAMGLCPQGNGNTATFLNGNLAWATPAAAAAVPLVRLRHSVAQALASGSYTLLAFDTEDFDTNAMHSTVTNNSRITAATAGKYVITGQVTIAANATGTRIGTLTKNGSTTIAAVSQPPSASVNTSLIVRTVIDLAVGDYVTFSVYQNSGGSLNANANASYSPVFSAYKVG